MALGENKDRLMVQSVCSSNFTTHRRPINRTDRIKLPALKSLGKPFNTRNIMMSKEDIDAHNRSMIDIGPSPGAWDLALQRQRLAPVSKELLSFSQYSYRNPLSHSIDIKRGGLNETMFSQDSICMPEMSAFKHLNSGFDSKQPSCRDFSSIIHQTTINTARHMHLNDQSYLNAYEKVKNSKRQIIMAESKPNLKIAPSSDFEEHKLLGLRGSRGNNLVAMSMDFTNRGIKHENSILNMI